MTESLPGEVSYREPDGDVAVLLNANAGRVNRSIARLVQTTLPGATLYWTRSLAEAEDAMESVLVSGFQTLFCGGGDGTIIDMANRLRRFAAVPRLGILRLGTGNALASWAGARAVAADLLAWAHSEPFQEIPLRMIEAAGESFPFAGLGWDAAVLNDYRKAKESMEATPLRRLSNQAWVYVAAGVGRTMPRYALEREPPLATVRVLRGEAWRVDVQGVPMGERVPAGEILYHGPAHMIGLATTPFYGYNFRMFPHAELSSKHMQVRVSAMPIPKILNDLHRLWVGEISSPRLYDFLAEAVHLSFDQPVPYQVGGDARGERTELTASIEAPSVPVLSFA